VPRITKSFFISVVHRPLVAVRDVTTPEFSPRRSRTQNYEICGSIGAHLNNRVMSGTKGHGALIRKEAEVQTVRHVPGT
jgi:hypothetical protein